MTSTIVGAWNGSAYLFADAVRTSRDVPEERAEEYLSEKSLYFRGMLVWITFPPMLLLFFQQPVLLIIVYAALGALFLPFLAITLLWLLNSRRVAPEHRNGIVSNIILVASVLLFVFSGYKRYSVPPKSPFAPCCLAALIRKLVARAVGSVHRRAHLRRRPRVSLWR